MSETMYQGLEGNTGTHTGRGRGEGGGKVDRVCDAVREALEKLGENRYCHRAAVYLHGNPCSGQKHPSC